MMRPLWLCGLILALVGGCSKPAAAVYDGPVRHVVWISLDTTRPDHFGCYGADWMKTPNVDAIAAEGIVLDELLTAATTTLASHTSMFTGTYPHTHGVPRNGFIVHADNELLAEVLAARGFHASAFIASFALESRFGLNQGFELYDETFDIAAGTRRADQNQRIAARVTDAVLASLDGEPPRRNRFVFIHYFDPHAPYAPPAPYDEMYTPEGEAPLPDDRHPILAAAAVDEHDRRELARYAGEVSYLDAELGRLFSGLRERGILDQALLVITSDHGENLGERELGKYDHGWTALPFEARVVGILRGPGLPAARISGAVSMVDLMPSVLAYLGIALPARNEGITLELRAPAVGGTGQPCFTEATKPWEEVESEGQWYNARKMNGVRGGAHRYVISPFEGSESLFAVAPGPVDREVPMAEAPAEDIARLRALLEAWRGKADPLPSGFESARTSDTIGRLKSLGYLGGSDDDE